MKTISKFLMLFALAIFISCSNEPIEVFGEEEQSSEVSSERKSKKSDYCETAFAYFEGGCFRDDEDLNSKRWGWTIGPLSAPYKDRFPIYAGAGKCDLSKGEHIGDLYVTYLEDGTLDVYYEAYTGYGFFETHLYVGDEKFPRKNNGQFTVAPGQYGNSNSIPDGYNDDRYFFEDIEGEIYIIAHAVVCPWKLPQ